MKIDRHRFNLQWTGCGPKSVPRSVLIIITRSILKMLGSFATASHLTPIHQMSLAVLSRAACASMSTTTMTTTTRDREDCYGRMEWAQLLKTTTKKFFKNLLFSNDVTNQNVMNQQCKQTSSLPLGLYIIKIVVDTALHTRPASVMAFGAHHSGTCCTSHLQNVYSIDTHKKILSSS